MKFKQCGVTLIEVLVGFVIFTSSLVVVLDYVSEQVYHKHRVSAAVKKAELVYQLSTMAPYMNDFSAIAQDDYDGLSWNVASSVMDNHRERKNQIQLKRFDYKIDGEGQAFKWSVISLNQ